MFGFGKKKKSKAQNKIVFATIGQSNIVVWSSDEYEKFAKETYMENVIAYQCIDKRASAVASVAWKLMKINANGELGDEVLDWKFKKIFNKPNPLESMEQFLYKCMCYYLIKGDIFVWRNISTLSNYPTQFISLRPDKFNIKTDAKGYPIEYIYQDGNNKETYPIDTITGQSDILHIKSFHPLDDLFGMPRLKPASKDVDISNAGSRWNMNLLTNEARPGMIVMLQGFLTDEQFDNMQKQLQKHSGFENSGKNLILESEGGIADVKPYSWSPKDIDFLEGGRESARRISGSLGVPSMLLGIPGDNTYSNMKEARAGFWEDTVIPDAKMLIREFSTWLFGYPDETKYEGGLGQLTIEPDLNDIPALAYKEDLKWDRALKSGDFLMLDERRELVGYDALENDTGKVIFIPMSVTPLEQALEEPEPPPDFTSNDDYEEDEEQL